MYSMPVFDMIEASCRQWGLTRNKIITRLIMRSIYVVFTTFVATTLPFFGGKLFHTCRRGDVAAWLHASCCMLLAVASLRVCLTCDQVLSLKKHLILCLS